MQYIVGAGRQMSVNLSKDTDFAILPDMVEGTHVQQFTEARGHGVSSRRGREHIEISWLSGSTRIR